MKIFDKMRFLVPVIGVSFVFVFPASAQIKAKITVTAAKLDSVYGTHNIKLVFNCLNQMYFVDFSQSTPQILPLTGVTSAYYPVISQDGHWVTYQTGSDAEFKSPNPVAATSWVRELAAAGTPAKVSDTAFVPRFVQNTPADTPEILYSTSVACPTVGGVDLCFAAGQTLKRKIIGKAAQAPEVVFGTGSYYGGISWDNRYLNTAWEAGPNAFMLDLQDPSATPRPVHTMRTMKVKKDSTALDTFDMIPIGACNISRSASHIFTNTLLYFDFSSAAIKSAGCYHPILGTWKVHEKLFISRYDGEDLKVFDMPADQPVIPTSSAQGIGEPVAKQWDNPEWSNHPYFATAGLYIDRLFKVSGLWQHTYNTEAIYLVDLKDSSYVRLVQTTDTSSTSTTTFANPWIWVDASGLTEDSTWLAHTIWEKAGIDVAGKFTIGVKQDIRQPEISRSRIALLRNKNAVRIVVYSALGQEIASFSGSEIKEIASDKLFNKLRPGIYFIGIDSKGQKRQIVRWVKTLR